jgi:hypothetical protein
MSGDGKCGRLDLDACETVFSALQCHKLDDNAAYYGLGAICSLSTGDRKPHVDKFVSLGMIEELVLIMKHHSDKAFVLCNCSWLVRVLAPCTTAIHRISLFDLVIATIRVHSEDPELGYSILMRAFRAFEELARFPDGKLVLGDLACELVVENMKKHLSNRILTLAGCGAIWNLSNGPANAEKVLAAGTCEILLSAVQQHMDSPMIGQYVCGALGCIAGIGRGIKTMIGSLGFCEAVTSVLRTHITNSDCCETAIRAITSLSQGCDENKIRLKASGADEILEQTISQYSSSPAIKALIMDAKSALSLSKD